MTEEELISLAEKKIYSFTGLNLEKVHKQRVIKLLQKKADKLSVSLEKYVTNLNQDSDDFDEFISLVTVNETYFFRERVVFQYLKNIVFPSYAGKKVRIWSGASSTGEEPISLLALALECGLDAEVYASDIDNGALNTLRNGVYRQFSFRNDGKEFTPILNKYGHKEGDFFIFNKDFINRLNIANYNLISSDPLPFNVKFDIVFLRNVFIYFDRETRCNIVKKISSQINYDGLLFFSINEVGSFANEFTAYSLYKTNNDSLYFFKKLSTPPVVTKTKKVEVYKKSENITVPKVDTKPYVKPVAVTANIVTEKKEVKFFSTDQLKESYEGILKLINAQKFDQALALALEYEKNHETKPYAKYFAGIIKYHADEREEACKFFEASFMLRSDFWPSYFYNGLVLRDMGQYTKANKMFLECRTIMDLLGKNADKYDFILDSFDPAYIYNLCDKLQSGESK